MAKLIGRASATAVTATLTTLIDWTNIQSVDAFEIVVKNVGGGSGSNITDVRIDTSSDGGTTVNLDDVTDAEMNITIPITSGNTQVSTATFAKTAMTTATNKWLRVRATATVDTTVSCWLTATSTSRLTLTELADEVRAQTGAASDTELLTAVRVYKHLTWTQREIARRIPGIYDLHVESKTHIALATNTKSYALSALTYPAAHIHRVRIIDTASAGNCFDLEFTPLDIYDRNYPYPEGNSAGQPVRYTRRADSLEVNPIPSSSYNAQPLYIDYSKWPADLTVATDEPDIADADELLIAGGVYRGYRAMGHVYRNEAEATKQVFEYILDEWAAQETRLLDWPEQMVEPGDDLEP